jgi:hypothetical protein
MAKRNTKPRNKPVMTRRQALAMMGKTGLLASAFEPARLVVGSLVDGMIAKAQADAGPGPRNYVHIGLEGGPTRWTFDQPLAPYEPLSALAPCQQVYTRFNATTGALEYGVVSVTRNGATLNMPSLWANTIPTVGGGSAPMVNLLDNMLMMRGINLQQDGHPNNFPRQMRPVASAPSLGGRVADNASTPIPAVAIGGSPWEAYKSDKGVGQVYQDYLYDGALNEILRPFNVSQDGLSSTYVSRRNAMDSAIKTALASLGAYASSGMPGADNLYRMAGTAEAFLKAGIGNVSAEYTALEAKYQGLINACSATPIIGVSDRSLSKDNYLARHMKTNGAQISTPDLKNIITSSSTIPQLAGNFAIIEYMLRNKYSSTIMIGVGAASGFDYFNGGGDMYHYFDEHGAAVVPSLISCSFTYRALAACLYELITVLKANNLWYDTLIHIGGDFAREPNYESLGGGSEHGWRGSCGSVLCGGITRPIVVGNIALDSGAGNVGTWGRAAPVSVEGTSRELTIGHLTSSISHLLRIQPLMPNDTSLVVESGNQVLPTVELAKVK